ncbi:MAG: hypothetical protein IJ565_03685 [Bacilli bacterium]|nr:hypothetical protein [Bacilli bacterium]
MFFVLAKEVTCGDVTVPAQIVGLTTLIYNVIRIGIPLLLIIMGMLDLGKAVISQKEDDIKKNQKVFVSRLIAAAIVFFVFTIVKLVVTLVAGEDGQSIMACVSSLLGAK